MLDDALWIGTLRYMEIRTLRYFLAAAREENLTRAAEQLHVTQPTLSKQTKALEQELGQQLFVRHSFSVELTDEGALLRERAEDLVRLADRIEGEFLSLGSVTGGDIYFGLAESWQIGFLAREIAAFKRAYPGLRYHISSGDTRQVTEHLDRGVLDFAAIAEEPDPEKYESLDFPGADIWGLIVPRGSGLAKKDGVSVDDLVGLPLFCSGQGWRCDIPRWAGKRMDELHLEGEFGLSYNASCFVREGLGYLLSFGRLIDTSEGSGLAFVPLVPKLETQMHLIWRRSQVFSPIAERFLEQLKRDFPAS